MTTKKFLKEKRSKPSSKSSASTKQPSGSKDVPASLNPSQKSSSSQPTLGLDLSLTGMGLVVWDGRRVVRHRRYKTEPEREFSGLNPPPSGQLAPDRFRGVDEARINWLARKVIFAVRKFEPRLVVIEGHAFAARGRGVSILHELHGVVKHHLWIMEMPFVLVPATTLKLHATGNGKATKFDMIHAAKDFCSEISDSDRADALHLAVYGDRNYFELVEEG